MTKNSTRHNGLVDGSPVLDVKRGDKISFSLETTGNASKLGSFRPVLLAYGVANGAFPAGIPWFNNDNWNPSFLRLILYEGPELTESPRIMDILIAFPNSCPHPYATEVLNGNCGRGAFGFLNDFLRYYMVDIPDKAALPPRKLLQMTFRRPSPDGLKSGAKVSIVLPDIIDFVPRIILTSRIYSDIDDSDVHPDYILHFDGWTLRDFYCNHQVELLVYSHEVALPPDPLEGYFTIFSDGHRYPYSPFCRANAHFINALETEYSLVIDNGTEIPEFMEMGSVGFICFNNLCYNPDGKLCCQSKFFPYLPIHDFLEENFIVKFFFKRYFGNKITGTVEFDEGIDQRFLLFIIWKQFYLEGFKHNIDTAIQYITVSQFLSILKDWSFLAIVHDWLKGDWLKGKYNGRTWRDKIPNLQTYVTKIEGTLNPVEPLFMEVSS